MTSHKPEIEIEATKFQYDAITRQLLHSHQTDELYAELSKKKPIKKPPNKNNQLLVATPQKSKKIQTWPRDIFIIALAVGCGMLLNTPAAEEFVLSAFSKYIPLFIGARLNESEQQSSEDLVTAPAPIELKSAAQTRQNPSVNRQQIHITPNADHKGPATEPRAGKFAESPLPATEEEIVKQPAQMANPKLEQPPIPLASTGAINRAKNDKSTIYIKPSVGDMETRYLVHIEKPLKKNHAWQSLANSINFPITPFMTALKEIAITFPPLSIKVQPKGSLTLLRDNSSLLFMMLQLPTRHYGVVLFRGNRYQAIEINQQNQQGLVGKKMAKIPPLVLNQFKADYMDQFHMNIAENSFAGSVFNFSWFEILIPGRSVILYLPINTIIDGKQIQYLNLRNHENVAKAIYRAAK